MGRQLLGSVSSPPLRMGITFVYFNLDGYCPVKMELFIVCANGRESTLMEDFNTRTGQEYKPCDLLVGRSKISVSSSMELTGSKKNELGELRAGR